MTVRLRKEFDEDLSKDSKKWKGIRFSITHLFNAEYDWCYAKVRYMSPKSNSSFACRNPVAPHHVKINSKDCIFYTLEPIEAFTGGRYNIRVQDKHSGTLFYLTKHNGVWKDAHATKENSFQERISSSIHITADRDEPREVDGNESQLVVASTALWKDYNAEDHGNYHWKQLNNRGAWELRLRSLRHQAFALEERE